MYAPTSHKFTKRRMILPAQRIILCAVHAEKKLQALFGYNETLQCHSVEMRCGEMQESEAYINVSGCAQEGRGGGRREPVLDGSLVTGVCAQSCTDPVERCS